MRVTPLTRAEWDVVQRFVTFLNLQIETTAQVEDHFAVALLVDGAVKRIPADEAHKFRDDQATLRALVTPLADAFNSPRRRRDAVRALVPDLRRALARHPPDARFVIEANGRLRPVYRLPDVLLCCYLATGLLIDPERGLLGRFGRCGSCGRFTITYEGKPRRHCDDDHAEQFRRKTGAARVARHRKRQRRLRRQKGQ